MAEDCQLHSFDLKGFWMDVGQPKDYLTGVGLFLDSLAKHGSTELSASAPHIKGSVLIHPTAQIGKDCLIGPNVTIGPNVVIADGVRITKSAIFEGAVIQSHTSISSSIIGWRANIGKWVRVEGGSVLGDDVAINDELFINGACVLPHKGLSASVHSPQIIM